MRSRFALALAALAAFVSPVPAREFAPAAQASRTATLVEAHGVGDLAARFNQDRGRTRLVLLVSPT